MCEVEQNVCTFEWDMYPVPWAEVAREAPDSGHCAEADDMPSMAPEIGTAALATGAPCEHGRHERNCEEPFARDRTSPGLGAFALPTVEAGLAGLREVMQAGLRPVILRLYDSDEARHLAVPQPPAEAVVLAGFTGVPTVAAAERQAAVDILSRLGARSLGSAPAESWLRTRYDFSRVEQLLDEPGGYAETIEIAHGWTDMLSTYETMKHALAPLADEVLVHFSHPYTDGTSLYLILLGRAQDDSAAVHRLETIWAVAMETALAAGAVISHHHGVGRARARYLADQLGEGTTVLAKLKGALDPASVLQPGIFEPVSGALEASA